MRGRKKDTHRQTLNIFLREGERERESALKVDEEIERMLQIMRSVREREIGRERGKKYEKGRKIYTDTHTHTHARTHTHTHIYTYIAERKRI